MPGPKVAKDSTPAFFGCALFFLGVTMLWNLANLWMLDLTAQERWTMAMGVLVAMFATMVVCKVVRDRADAQELVNEVRAARYEEMLSHAPAPGLGEL